jgi:hypothetical protein
MKLGLVAEQSHDNEDDFSASLVSEGCGKSSDGLRADADPEQHRE